MCFTTVFATFPRQIYAIFATFPSISSFIHIILYNIFLDLNRHTFIRGEERALHSFDTGTNSDTNWKVKRDEGTQLSFNIRLAKQKHVAFSVKPLRSRRIQRDYRTSFVKHAESHPYRKILLYLFGYNAIRNAIRQDYHMNTHSTPF